MVKSASIERGKPTKPNRPQVRSLAWAIKKEFTNKFTEIRRKILETKKSVIVYLNKIIISLFFII